MIIWKLQFITFIIDPLNASISDVFGHMLPDAFLGRCVKWPIYYWIEKKSFKKRKAGHFDNGIWRRISNQGPLPYVTLHPCTRLKLFARWAKNLRNTFVTQSALSTTTIRFKQILYPFIENGPFGRIWNILCENQSRTDAMELIESSKGAILPKSRWNSNLKRGSYPPTSHPTSHPQKRFISTPPLARSHHCTKSFYGLQRPSTSLRYSQQILTFIDNGLWAFDVFEIEWELFDIFLIEWELLMCFG